MHTITNSISNKTLRVSMVNDNNQHEEEHALMIDEMFQGCNEEELNEAMQAERDVLGGGQSISQPHEHHTPFTFDARIMETALNGFHEALHVLPTEQKQAYLLAKTRNPQIVEMEANPKQFLKACQYNYWKAAESYALYWKKRLETFGEDHYHKALTITDSKFSALSAQDIEGLKSGANVLIPQTDDFGRIVLLADRDQMNHCVQDPTIRLRMCFYMLNILLEQDQAVSNGFVWIFAFEDKSDPSKTENKAWNSHQSDNKPADDNDMMDDSIPQISTDDNNDNQPGASGDPLPAKTSVGGGALKLLLSQVIPIQLKALHVVAKRSPTLMERIVQLWLLFFQSITFLKMRMRMHFVASADMALENIKPFGLAKAHLPSRLGGTATAVQETWFEDRRKLEQTRYAFLWISHKTKDDSIVRRSFPAEGSSSVNTTARTDGEIALKRKLMQVMNHEKTQDREISYLKSIVNSLTRQNQLLNQERDFLVSLNGCAQFLLGVYLRDKLRLRYVLQRAVKISCTNDVTFSSWPPLQQATLFNAVTDFILKHYVVCEGRHAGVKVASNLRRSEDRDHARKIQSALQSIMSCFWKDELTSPTVDTSTHSEDGDDTELHRLQSIARFLKDRQSFLKRQANFLEHLKTCAQFLANQTDYDMTKLRSFMEAFFIKFRPETTESVPVELMENPDLAKILADYFLQSLVFYRGRQKNGKWIIEQSTTAPGIMGINHLMNDVRKFQAANNQTERESLGKLKAQVEIIQNLQHDRVEEEAGSKVTTNTHEPSNLDTIESLCGFSEESVQTEVEVLLSKDKLEENPLVEAIATLLNDRRILSLINGPSRNAFVLHPPMTSNTEDVEEESLSKERGASATADDTTAAIQIDTSLLQRLKNRQRAIKAKKRRRL